MRTSLRADSESTRQQWLKIGPAVFSDLKATAGVPDVWSFSLQSPWVRNEDLSDPVAACAFALRKVQALNTLCEDAALGNPVELVRLSGEILGFIEKFESRESQTFNLDLLHAAKVCLKRLIVLGANDLKSQE